MGNLRFTVSNPTHSCSKELQRCALLPEAHPFMNTLDRYLQVAQDETVVDIFGGKKGGFFVDLASNDAVKLSNTLSECSHETQVRGWLMAQPCDLR